MSIVDTVRNVFVPIHREGWPFIAGFAAVTLVLGLFSDFLFWIGLILTAWCAYFFRDPERVTPIDDRLRDQPGRRRRLLGRAGGAAARARPRQ